MPPAKRLNEIRRSKRAACFATLCPNVLQLRHAVRDRVYDIYSAIPSVLFVPLG